MTAPTRVRRFGSFLDRARDEGDVPGGENGTSKSTLIEAAVAAGFNPEDGSQNFRFATHATESSLGDHWC